MRADPHRLRWTIAAGLSVAVAIVGLVVYDIPSLVAGAAASPDPYWLVLGSFASDVVAFIAAYGAVRGQRWGVVLLLVVNAYWFLQAVTGLLAAGSAGETAFSAVMLVVHAVTVWLCLGRRRAPAATG
jgi:hypothetical protein